MFIKTIKNSILSRGKTIESPIFIKEFTNKDSIIGELERLKATIKDQNTLVEIDDDINKIKIENSCEKNVYYELKNSFLPIVCLHNLYIQNGSYEAKIDFLVITSQFICILETKSLSGDIVVNNNGEFIKQIKDATGKIIKEEGIYNPITQNERRVEIIRDFLCKNNKIKNCPVFSLNVMSNTMSSIDMTYAPKYVKEQIIKYDQISRKLKELIEVTDVGEMVYQTIMDIGNFLKRENIEKQDNQLISKYKDSLYKRPSEPKMMNKETNTVENRADKITSDINIDALTKELKKYRFNKAKEGNHKAYFIFSNREMEDLIEKMPTTKDELMKVFGFGKVKTEKYGDDLVKIVKKYKKEE